MIFPNKTVFILSLRTLALLMLGAFATPLRGDDAELAQQWQSVQPLLAQHCGDCHTGDDAQAGIRLEKFENPGQILQARKTWLKISQQIEAGIMPPAQSEPIPAAEKVKILEFIQAATNAINCVKDPNPGKVTVRRLNRFEYANTVRDLTGVDYAKALEFPGDDVGYGFDNIGDVLTLPPILLEKYIEAAEEISKAAIVIPPSSKRHKSEWTGSQLKIDKGGQANGNFASLSSAGEAYAQEQIPWPGMYKLVVTASGDQAGDEPVKAAVVVDGKPIKTLTIPNKRGEPKEYSVTLRLKSGRRKIGIEFLNDFYRDDGNGQKLDRNLMVEHVTLEGEKPGTKIPDSELPESHKRLIAQTPTSDDDVETTTRSVVQRLANRAFRRPATTSEVDRWVGIAQQVQADGESFEASIQVVLQGLLLSPQFLFRIEKQREPTGPNKYAQLDDFELATRISYFLWSTMPDDELFRLAAKKQLSDPKILRNQIERMLTDRRANQFVENFVGQWLQLRKLDELQPSKQQFPQFNDALRNSMKRETFTFFASVMRNDESVLNLLDSDYTYLNQSLAEFYGISGVEGDQFRRVSLNGTVRGGLLTQASILAVTSNPTRTSPVKRGKFVLDNLLGTPPPAAPPGVPELKEKGELTGTLRQRMEQHRADPACAACHQLMDPLGFALENFDAVGQWRLKDGKDDIDASGELPGGVKVDGAVALRKLLKEKYQDRFVRCLIEKTLTYSIGRGLDYYDLCTVEKIEEQLKQSDYRFSTMIFEIVRSDAFQKIGSRE
jgi:mono/diheme cytochrome c family protein